MAHRAQRLFCSQVKKQFPEFFRNVRVLEVGSRNVNGSIRELFEECDYIGIDIEPGKGVDTVCPGHDYRDEPGALDVVCSAETFEHDPYADLTIQNMIRLLRSGGLLFMTCAGEGRKEHGTAKTGTNYGPDPNFYRNVSIQQFLEWAQIESGTFNELHLQYNPQHKDLYFWGLKA